MAKAQTGEDSVEDAVNAGKLKERLKAFPRQTGESRKAWKARSIRALRKLTRKTNGEIDKPPYNVWGYTGEGPEPPKDHSSDSSKGKAAGKGKGKGKGSAGKSSKNKGKDQGKGKASDSWSTKPTWWSKDSYVTTMPTWKPTSSSWGTWKDSSWGAKDSSWGTKDKSWWKKSDTWDKWSSGKKGW